MSDNLINNLILISQSADSTSDSQNMQHGQNMQQQKFKFLQNLAGSTHVLLYNMTILRGIYIALILK